MVIFTNTTTARLEGYARARGLDLGVIKVPDNSRGVFFVSRLGSKVLTSWITLGWTAADARHTIDNWGRSCATCGTI